MSLTTTELERPVVSETFEVADNEQQAAATSSPPENSKLDRAVYVKIISAGFSFFVAGVNDGSIGALVPYVIRDYGINTAIVSSV